MVGRATATIVWSSAPRNRPSRIAKRISIFARWERSRAPKPWAGACVVLEGHGFQGRFLSSGAGRAGDGQTRAVRVGSGCSRTRGPVRLCDACRGPGGRGRASTGDGGVAVRGAGQLGVEGGLEVGRGRGQPARGARGVRRASAEARTSLFTSSTSSTRSRPVWVGRTRTTRRSSGTRTRSTSPRSSMRSMIPVALDMEASRISATWPIGIASWWRSSVRTWKWVMLMPSRTSLWEPAQRSDPTARPRSARTASATAPGVRRRGRGQCGLHGMKYLRHANSSVKRNGSCGTEDRRALRPDDRAAAGAQLRGAARDRAARGGGRVRDAVPLGPLLGHDRRRRAGRPRDAWAVLAGLARETTRIGLGALVSPVGFRLPGNLAKVVATVDEMSGGRVELGVGAGWQRGRAPPARACRSRRSGSGRSASRRRWRSCTACGRARTAGRSSAGTTRWRTRQFRPKPGSLPGRDGGRPNLIVGGQGTPRSYRIAARYADEFNVSSASPQIVGQKYAALDETLRAAGRDPSTLVHAAMSGMLIGRDRDEVRRREADLLAMLGGGRRRGGLARAAARALDPRHARRGTRDGRAVRGGRRPADGAPGLPAAGPRR